MNKRKFGYCITALSILNMSIAAYAGNDPISLAPSSPWVVNYADDSCRLAREFGANDQLSTILIDKFAPGESFKVSLVGKLLTPSSETGKVSLKFGSVEEPQKFDFMLGDTDKHIPMTFINQRMRIAPLSPAEFEQIKHLAPGDKFDVAPIEKDRQAAAKFLLIEKPNHVSVKLETGPWEKPIAALDNCIDALVRDWGLDPAKMASLSRAPKPTISPAKWITTNDYPMDLAIMGARAIVNFRIVIDDKGNPTSCHIQQSTKRKEFDDVVCKAVMKKARFNPALDADQKPTASYWITTVAFDIPH